MTYDVLFYIVYDIWYMIYDIWYTIYYIWYVVYDIWHMTSDMWYTIRYDALWWHIYIYIHINIYYTIHTHTHYLNRLNLRITIFTTSRQLWISLLYLFWTATWPGVRGWLGASGWLPFGHGDFMVISWDFHGTYPLVIADIAKW